MPAQGTSARSLLGAGAGLIGFSAIAGLLVTVMVAPAIAVTGMTANNSIGVFQDLPDYIEISAQHQRNTFVAYAQDGTEVTIANYYDQNREEVSLDAIDEDLKWAAIDGEDRRFEEHGGVDVPSLIRAALGQATGSSSSGASTLTMQLVRNILVLKAVNNTELDEEEYEQAIRDATYPDLNRKLKEMKLAISLEKRYTKDQILEAYLNIVLMGQTTYGVEAGAQRYFGTTAKEVTPAQAASLIAIVQNPSKNGLYTADNFEANKKRRDVILGWMHTQGHLDKAAYEEALATPIDETTVSQNAPRSGCASAPVEYRFPCDYALKSILNGEVESLGDTKEEQLQRWREGGLKVVLSINANLQGFATQIAADRAPANETRMQLGAAISSVEVGTGRILIMAQNKAFDDTGAGDKLTTTAVNFNGDIRHGGSKGFQPGSTYKPYVLLAFLAAGHGLNETFNASIRSTPMAKFQDSCNGPHGGPDYTYRNDSGEGGLYNAIRGTAGSVNSVFVQMAAEVDQCDIAKLAASIGVHRADGKEDGSDLSTLPSCSLGGCTNNIAPLTQANAYAAIANQGTYCEPIIIDKFIADDGTEIPGQDAHCSPSLVTPAVANTAAYAMEAVVTSGTARASNPHGHDERCHPHLDGRIVDPRVDSRVGRQHRRQAEHAQDLRERTLWRKPAALHLPADRAGDRRALPRRRLPRPRPGTDEGCAGVRARRPHRHDPRGCQGRDRTGPALVRGRRPDGFRSSRRHRRGDRSGGWVAGIQGQRRARLHEQRASNGRAGCVERRLEL
jgi:membrane peptidoglycan carboxypeptidase